MDPQLELHPIFPEKGKNQHFLSQEACLPYLSAWTGFYQKVGFHPPWIGYFAQLEGEYVGTCAFKGPPQNGQVEIAYGTFEHCEGKGMGTAMCRLLVELARETDATLTITARTLPQENASTRILTKNHFELMGTVIDPEDGEVWEWRYQGT